MGDNKKPLEPEDIPTAVLHQLGEHTVGGYVLFYFNPQTEFPQHKLSFDSPAHCLAMQKYIADWSKVLQDLYHEGVKEQMKIKWQEDNDSEDETGEEEE